MKANDDNVLRQYLLGSLSEEETARFDELSISDDEFVFRLSSVENDLVDSYARGELSGETLEQFKSFYLLSPRRREKVRFAQTLSAFSQKQGNAETQSLARSRQTVAPPSRSSFFGFGRSSLRWGFAIGVLVVLLAGGYLFFENRRLQNQIRQAQSERRRLEEREQELQKQIEERRAAETETAKELERIRESLLVLEQEQSMQKGGGTNATPGDLSIVSFTLLPQKRGAAQVPTITVQQRTDFVALHLALESDDFREYKVTLKSLGDNRNVWRSGNLKARPSGARPSISISLRAGLLRPQNYMLEVTGISRSGAAEFITGYPFTVVSK